ncbi:MAG: murein biosynthesis integral membrane protein MurJ [Gammaproteobacteria bacterium]|nr:murein biosynthesis integral membrane protein MurJ [Gammaproteobacteria bacterium]NVK89161.1 murein biosynthesis integral membrane protein MurJ [Gammaproteobacteria bacterium]
MTLLSRVLGLVRDIVIANVLGAQAATDVFLVAQKIPNFLRRLFGEGAFAQAFVPVLSEYQQLQDRQAVLNLVSKVSGTLGGILLVVTLLGVVGSPLLAGIFGYGFIEKGETEKYYLVSELLKVTFPYILFISLTAFAGSVLNSLGRFAVPAFAPVLLNICIIFAAVWISPLLEEPVRALAWAIFVAGILQLLLHLPFLWRQGYLVKPQWGWRDSGVRKVLKLMIPALFGVSVAQINLLLDTVIASFLVTGSITWLYLSDRMLEFPLGIFGIAIATVILPSLSRQHAQNDAATMSRMLNWALHMVLLIGLPAAVGLFILAEPVMLSVFQHGNFSLYDASMAALSLQAYVFGLLSFMFIKVLATGYFSRQNTRTPVKIGIIAMVINMVVNLLLFKPYGHVGLAIATAVSATMNASLLWVGLIRNQTLQMDRQWWWWGLRAVLAATVMFAVIEWLQPTLEQWQLSSLWQRGWQLALCISLGVVSYLFSLWALGLRLRDVKSS